MNEHSDSVMVALLPITTDWCKIDLPHMTLVFAGKTGDLDPGTFNEIAKDASSLALLSGPVQLQVTGKEVFGDGTADSPQVDVFTLRPTPELWAMRRSVEKWNASDFPFNPHVTIGPVGTVVDEPPRWLAFNKILVAWGTDYLTFSLRN